MNRKLGLPADLATIGMRAEHIPDLVARAERNRWFFDEVNPRLVSTEDLAGLYAEALRGGAA
jgi:alcohol dehydrogenase class IV